MTITSLDISTADANLIALIATRAQTELGADPMTTSLDLTACHSNGTQLRLQKLLEAKPADFSHDINGIRRHIRRDGKFDGVFTPRFSK